MQERLLGKGGTRDKNTFARVSALEQAGLGVFVVLKIQGFSEA